MSENNMKTPILPNEARIPDGLPGGFFIYSATGNEDLCYADPNVIALFECSDIGELRAHIGNSFRGMVLPEDIDKVESDILAQTFNSGRRHDYVRYRIRTRKGNIRYVEDFGHLLFNREGEAYFYVYIVDVEENEYYNNENNSQAEARLFQMNKRMDPLTGLLNMTAFYEDAKETLLDRAVNGDNPSTIVVFDILGLRDVNRTIGRDEGDARILALAKAIRTHMPEDCKLFRGYEAELIAACPRKTEWDIIDRVMDVIHACKSPVLFGIGSTGASAMNPTYAEKSGTMTQALEEAQCDLRIKKMLNSDSERSQALTSLVRALEETDSDTEAHVQRTQKMGEALGRKVKLTDVQITLLQLLCLLHDIGKITVPLEILNKPGRLSDAEWSVLRSHADKGYQIAMVSEELKPIAEMIRYHHERWDGKGYPTRLAREEIPVLSRIISIVDAYDAMVNDRSYRKALPPEVAQKEIRDNAGTQFDPFLASEFLALLQENPALAVGARTGGGEVRLFDKSKVQEVAEGNTSPVVYSRYILDIDETIIETDDRFEKITGFSRADVVGRMTQFDLIPKEDLAQYRQQVQNQFSRADIAYLRHRIQCKDGSTKEVICNGERYYDSSVKAFRSTLLIFEL